MKIRKIIAAVAASAVALSAMAVNAFAALTNAGDGGNYLYDVLANGYDVTEVYGVTFTISDWDTSAGIGGGIGANSASTGWEQHEWGNADAGKEITLADDNTITFKKSSPIFKESDATDPTNPYAQLWIQQWWGSDVSVDNVVLLGADGNVLSPAPVEEAAPADEDEGSAEAPAAEEEAAPEAEEIEETADEAEEITEDEAPVAEEAPAVTEAPANTTAAPATGNVPAAVMVSVMAVAGAAVVASRKRK